MLAVACLSLKPFIRNQQGKNHVLLADQGFADGKLMKYFRA
jgi:hypothetical protein